MPVRRSTSRHTKSEANAWTEEDVSRLKDEFLKAYSELGTMWEAAKKVGIHRVTAQTWKNEDPSFLLAFKQSEEQRADHIENLAIKAAEQGDSKILLHMLKCTNREKYGDSRNLTLSGPGGGPVGLAFTDPDAVKAQIIAVAHQFPTIAPKIRETLRSILDALPQ